MNSILTTMETSSTSNSNGCIKLVAHNVNGLCSSKPYIDKLLSSYDIVGISEHWLSGPELYKLDNLAQSHSVVYKCHNDLQYAPPERGRGYGGVALYCNKNLTAAPLVNIQSDKICGIKIKCNDEYFCVLNVYLPHTRGNASSHLDHALDKLSSIIAEHSGNCNMVIMGDFNVHFGSMGGSRGNGPCPVHGERILQVLCNETVQLMCYDMSKYASGPAFSFEKSGIGRSWIDHIFAPICLEKYVVNCGVVEEDILNVSDHLPVSLVLSLNGYSCTEDATILGLSDHMPKQRVKWHKLSKEVIHDKYTALTESEFEELYTDLKDRGNDTSVDCMSKVITERLLHVSEINLCKAEKQPRCNPKPFWNKELSHLLKEKKAAYNAWKEAGCPRDQDNALYTNHICSKKIFRKKFRMAEAVFRAGIEEEIEACNELNQRQFWYLLKKDHQGQRHGNILRNSNGEIVTEKHKVVDMWKNHFSDLGLMCNDPKFDNNFKDFVESKVDQFNKSDEEMEQNVLSQPVTPDEVEKVCTNLKTGKAQDLTGLSYEHFKYAGRHVFIVLALLFNCIIESELLPKIFLKGITIPLFKGGDKDPLDKNDYRGISIQSVLCKIYDSVIISRSSQLIKDKLQICKTQSACEKGLSSVNASLLLQETVSHNTENRSKVYVTFFDAKKAFDTVWIDGLFYLLYCNGIKGKLWRLLRKAYLECLSSVLVNGTMSAWFRLFQGVKQGAVLSMLFYICFINGLIKELLNSNLGCHVLNVNSGGICYADDLAILSLNKVCMQHMVNIAHRFSCKWRFEFNPKKCAVLVFGGNGEDAGISLGNDEIRTTEDYTHVGIKLRTNTSGRLIDVKKQLDTCKRSLYCLIGCSLYKTNLSPVAVSKLYWSVVIPKLLANAEVRNFSEVELAEYEKFHRSVAKDIQHLPQFTPNPSVLALLGWRDIATHIEFIRLMFLYRLLALHPLCIYRVLFIRRFFYILASGAYSAASPIAMMIRVCTKYDILHIVLSWIDTGKMPSKIMWKKMVKKVLSDVTFASWRFEIKLYSKLSLFRVVVTSIKPSCWWMLARTMPCLKIPCCTMIKLLCASNVLAVNKKCNLPRSERLCIQCNTVEDTLHFIMSCNIFSTIRNELTMLIFHNLSIEGRLMWSQLGEVMQMYILMGLEFPLPSYDLYIIRYFSCIYVHRMYKERKALEPP